jgi:hypothetical protein
MELYIFDKALEQAGIAPPTRAGVNPAPQPSAR